MKTIEGKEYIVYFDEFNNVIDGEHIDPSSAFVTNLEDVTTERVEGYTIDEL